MGINSQTCYVFWLHPNFDPFLFSLRFPCQKRILNLGETYHLCQYIFVNDGLKGYITLVSHLGLLWTFSAFGGNINSLHSTFARFQLRSCILPFRMASWGISYCSNIPSDKYVNQSTVTGEHTCMVLKPLNNEDVESSGLDQWGFFSPFYQGGSVILSITLINPASFSFVN